MSEQPVSGGEAVTFELEADDLLLNRFTETTRTFASLLGEVSRDMEPGASVRWVVDRISMASPLRLEVRPVAPLSRSRLDDLSNTLVAGLEQVQSEARRPPHFSDTALEKAKTIAQETSTGARVRFVRRRRAHVATMVEVTAEFVRHVDEILGETIPAIGTVEGRLDRLNVHGENRVFFVYDDLTDDPIKCEFGHRIAVDRVGAAVGHRVAVQGEIFYRESGEIVRVKAHALDRFPDEEDLPTADDVRGILG